MDAAIFLDQGATGAVIEDDDIEDNLASYVAVVTVINFSLGVVVAAGAWAFGFPNPVIFGLLRCGMAQFKQTILGIQ